ncbi:hypothetical protein RXV86_06415 [Alisedimentitalea sp. MJ-SS2]|uniref:hypothetical protein n=1 Tax=Aliisedimentitalea sp. MJ-SS2 TaxID=3049795 RepID=UPI0029144B09|nr:hypothetical protein [Alisedimentitalea sp. MJ-SS2]MDU8927011.1 hypothetical protein [Alisedimentitalea sp. MJ-SS2]
MLFYPGGNTIDDLLIVDGVNHFGKAQYQIDDPLGDIGFKFSTGERIQAECVREGKNIIGDPECQRYEVYRSSFDPIDGTQADRPIPGLQRPLTRPQHSGWSHLTLQTAPVLTSAPDGL